MARIININSEAGLERLLADNDIVVIDFWAPWCPPCREFVPVLEQAAERHPEVVFCRASMEDSKELAQAFEVESIPTLIVVRERIMIVSQPGYLAPDKLEELMGKVLELDMEQLRQEMSSSQSVEGGQE